MYSSPFEWNVACNIMPNMFLLEDYARQIGVDIQNSEIHGYINPYAYEINRKQYFKGMMSRYPIS